MQILLFLFLFLTLGWSQETPIDSTVEPSINLSIFTLQNGNQKVAEFIMLRNDTITFNATVADSSIQTIKLPKEIFKSILLPDSTFVPLTQNTYPMPKGFPVEAQILSKGGLSKSLQFIAMQQDTLYLQGEFENGATHTVLLHKQNFHHVIFSHGDTLDLSLHNFAFTQKPKRRPPPVLPDPIVFLKASQEGAQLFINNKKQKQLLPCSLQVKPGEYSFQTYWQLEGNRWGGQRKVKLQKGDKTEISIKMNPISPNLQITSTPPAQIYFSLHPDLESSTPIHTPWQSEIQNPRELYITLYKAGYRDTTLQVTPNPIEETKIHVQLERDISPIGLKKQKQDNSKQWRHRFWAIGLSQLIVGATLQYLAQSDFEKAKEKRDLLESPLLNNTTSAIYQKTLQQNKEHNENGLRKEQLGNILFAGAGVSFTLSFCF